MNHKETTVNRSQKLKKHKLKNSRNTVVGEKDKDRSIFKNCIFIYSQIWKISKSRMIIPIFLAILGSLCTIAIMLFPKLIIDSISKEKSFIFIISIILIRVGITLVYNILFRIFSEKYFPLAESKINEHFVTELYKKTAFIDLKNLDSPEFYDKYSRAIDKAQEVPGTLLGLYNSFLTFIFDTIALILTLTYIGPWTILIVIISFAFNTWINSWISKKDYEFEVKTTGEKRIFEYIKRIFYIPQYKNDLLFFNLDQAALEKYDQANDSFIKKIFGYKPLRAFVSSVSNFVFNLINLGAGGIYLAMTVAAGHATIGTLVSGLYAMEELGNVFSSAGSIIPQFRQASFFIDDYRDVMESYSTLYTDSGFYLPKTKIQNISFRDVSFGYQDGKNIIENLNVEIKGGTKVALVGQNGAGKSTFLKLLLKLYQPTGGKIFLNQMDLSEINTSSFYKLCSPMFQETNCYALSVTENIKIADADYDELAGKNENVATAGLDEKLSLESPELDVKNKISSALEKSGIAEKISSLPEKAETLMVSEVNEGGIDFSGGETQKIGIARIMYRDSGLIVMDEPSAALDPISEQKLYDTLDSLSKEKTLIIVSHRLSSVKNMDRILFFEKGKIAEDGSHIELMKMNGKYAQMFRLQSKRYGEEETSSTVTKATLSKEEDNE